MEKICGLIALLGLSGCMARHSSPDLTRARQSSGPQNISEIVENFDNFRRNEFSNIPSPFGMRDSNENNYLSQIVGIFCTAYTKSNPTLYAHFNPTVSLQFVGKDANQNIFMSIPEEYSTVMQSGHITHWIETVIAQYGDVDHVSLRHVIGSDVGKYEFFIITNGENTSLSRTVHEFYSVGKLQEKDSDITTFLPSQETTIYASTYPWRDVLTAVPDLALNPLGKAQSIGKEVVEYNLDRYVDDDQAMVVLLNGAACPLAVTPRDRLIRSMLSNARSGTSAIHAGISYDASGRPHTLVFAFGERNSGRVQAGFSYGATDGAFDPTKLTFSRLRGSVVGGVYGEAVLKAADRQSQP